MTRPWERQPGESRQAFEAFCLYRDLPYAENPTSRSFAKVAQALNKSRTLMGRWSTAHDWQERCRDYDNEIQKQEFEARKRAYRKMQQEHIALAGELAEKARAALGTLTNRSIKPRDIVDFLKLSTELERRARGEQMTEDGPAADEIKISIVSKGRANDDF